jgi:hypothetical protein
MTWCSPRLESAGGVAELPDHGGVEAARSELQCVAVARVCGVLWWARAQEQSGNRLIRRPGHPRRVGWRGGRGDPGGPLCGRWRRGRREGRGKRVLLGGVSWSEGAARGARCWLGLGQVAGPGGRGRKEKGARGPLGRGTGEMGRPCARWLRGGADVRGPHISERR